MNDVRRDHERNRLEFPSAIWVHLRILLWGGGHTGIHFTDQSEAEWLAYWALHDHPP